MAKFLDNQFSVGRIKVNLVDPEEWEYESPDIDYEVKKGRR